MTHVRCPSCGRTCSPRWAVAWAAIVVAIVAGVMLVLVVLNVISPTAYRRFLGVTPGGTTLFSGSEGTVDGGKMTFAASYTFFVPGTHRSGAAANDAVRNLEVWLASKQTGYTRWSAEGSSGDGKPPRQGWLYRVSVTRESAIDDSVLRKAFGDAFGKDEPFYLFQ